MYLVYIRANGYLRLRFVLGVKSTGNTLTAGRL